MRILLATFANRGATNMGIGRQYNAIADVLEKQGHELIFFHHPTPLVLEKLTLKNTLIPMYAGIFSKRFGKVFESLKPDAVHIQSEIGVGVAARNYCASHNIPYSCGSHTNWEAFYPSSIVWPYLRWFFKPAQLIHASTSSVEKLLKKKGIQTPIATFPLGVDVNSFYYDPKPSLLSGYPRPYFMTLSRISREKNLDAFIRLSLPGTKFIIGNGPHKKYLEKKYSGKALFLPYDHVSNVRAFLSAGDVFVSPSLRETFGLTHLEALACGLPIAAFPVPGAQDIIEPGVCGYTNPNLGEAALACLSLKKEDSIHRAHQYSWENTASHFLKNQILLR